MQRDEQLLAGLLPHSEPIIHFYGWLRPSLTYGYFAKPGDLFHMDAIEARGIDLARRPTGGGALFHITDLAFSVLLPASHVCYSLNTLQNYKTINSAVLRAIRHVVNPEKTSRLWDPCTNSRSPQFCMAQPTIYDVVLNGKKVAGAAQRRTRVGLLHQGSIYLAPVPQELTRAVLRNGDTVAAAMDAASQPLLQEHDPSHVEIVRQHIKHRLVQELLAVTDTLFNE